MTNSPQVRIDKWLWAARFFKTRTMAADAIELGRVRIDGERIKPAREVRIGQRIEVRQGEARIEATVLALATQRGPAPVARLLYEEAETSIERRKQMAAARIYAAEPAAERPGRPTKRDRRRMQSL